ncbi:hypothetical protein BpHYR1_054264 [Brachionus plicatilis]|uniref:Uncharacterized protein n=1 Tax=Brachionus plicatilis TaxID=10195 RepID=A0A3M7Q8J8_BRAPC|nr:hypothetical protein BpHYR1_054264 [Brachionus plicatilis]
MIAVNLIYKTRSFILINYTKILNNYGPGSEIGSNELSGNIALVEDIEIDDSHKETFELKTLRVSTGFWASTGLERTELKENDHNCEWITKTLILN